MSETGSELVPSLQTVRASFAGIITRIVEYYQNGPHRYATVEDIASGIGLGNAAERETVYSAIDPYAEFAEKRDLERPLLFRRVAPGEYQFLGYSEDPLRLTKNVRITDPLLREAYDIFAKAIEKNGQGAELRTLTIPERAASFHRNLLSSSNILSIARDRIKTQGEFESMNLKLPD